MLGVGAQASPRYRPAGLLVQRGRVRVMIDGGPGAAPAGKHRVSSRGHTSHPTFGYLISAGPVRWDRGRRPALCSRLRSLGAPVVQCRRGPAKTPLV